MLRDGLAYYYSATGPGNLGDAVYIWTPSYTGSLLYPFAAPALITIPHSLAGSEIPVTTAAETWYQKTDGSWVTTAPTEETKGGYKTDSLGKYLNERRTTTAGVSALNAYLGAFGVNDTFALTVNEQSKATGEILGGLGTLADETRPETVTGGTVGSFPDSEYLKQNSAAPGGQRDSGGQGSTTSSPPTAKPELSPFSAEALSFGRGD